MNTKLWTLLLMIGMPTLSYGQTANPKQVLVLDESALDPADDYTKSECNYTIELQTNAKEPGDSLGEQVARVIYPSADTIETLWVSSGSENADGSFNKIYSLLVRRQIKDESYEGLPWDSNYIDSLVVTVTFSKPTQLLKLSFVTDPLTQLNYADRAEGTGCSGVLYTRKK